MQPGMADHVHQLWLGQGLYQVRWTCLFRRLGVEGYCGVGWDGFWVVFRVRSGLVQDGILREHKDASVVFWEACPLHAGEKRLRQAKQKSMDVRLRQNGWKNATCQF